MQVLRVPEMKEEGARLFREFELHCRLNKAYTKPPIDDCSCEEGKLFRSDFTHSLSVESLGNTESRLNVSASASFLLL